MAFLPDALLQVILNIEALKLLQSAPLSILLIKQELHFILKQWALEKASRLPEFQVRALPHALESRVIQSPPLAESLYVLKRIGVYHRDEEATHLSIWSLQWGLLHAIRRHDDLHELAPLVDEVIVSLQVPRLL